MAARSFRIESGTQGHHIYKELWTPTMGEELQTLQERDNDHDPYAIAVVKEGITVARTCPKGNIKTLLVLFGEAQHNYMQNNQQTANC